MDIKDIPEVEAIKKEWIKEVEQLEELKTNGGELNNNLNIPRLELEKNIRS